MSTHTFFGYRDAQRRDQAARLGWLFDLPNPADKITRDGLRMEHVSADTVHLSVTLTRTIDQVEANAIINAEPLPEEHTNELDTTSRVRQFADRVLLTQPIRHGEQNSDGHATAIPETHVAAVLHALADYTHNAHMLDLATGAALPSGVDALGRYFHALADSIEQRLAYVVCNRLLFPEDNTHCEFDGQVLIDDDGRGRCPWCRGTVYLPNETDRSA